MLKLSSLTPYDSFSMCDPRKAPSNRVDVCIKLLKENGLVSSGYMPWTPKTLVEKLNILPAFQRYANHIIVKILTLWDEVDSFPLMQKMS